MTFKGYLAFILILIAAKSEAAVLCSQALLPTRLISRSDVESTISDVAELIMELDLAKINGIDNPVISSMRANFPAKVAELNSKLSGKYSEAQVKKLVSDKVRELQNHDKLGTQKEAVQRAEQIKVNKGPFKLKGRISLEDVRGGFKESLFEYLPSIDSFLFQNASKQELIIMNAQSGERRVIQENNGTAAFLPKRNEIVAIDLGGNLLRYDLSSGEAHQSIKIFKKDVWGKVAISPNEDRIIVKDNYNATVIFLDRVQSGLMETKDVTKIPNNETVDYEFVSQNEILLANGNFNLLNLDTLQTSRVNTIGSGFSVHAVKISPDRKLLYWEGDRHEPKGVIPLSDFRNFEKVSAILAQEAYRVSFGKREDEVYLDLKISRGLYKFPDLTKAEQLLPLDPDFDRTRWGELPSFGTSEKMFTRHSNVLEIWERD